MDMEAFSVEMAEILIKVLPTDDEVKKFQEYLKEKKDPKLLPPDDRFLFDVRERGGSGCGYEEWVWLYCFYLVVQC